MKKILVVEDELDIRKNIVEILEYDNYQVIEAENGKKALSILEKEDVDLIITDVMMPVLDGVQFFEKTRNELLKDVPFIFLTAKGSREDVRNGMNKGADDYIVKPFDAQELLDSVSARIIKYEKIKKRFSKLSSNITKYVPHELRTPLQPILGYSDMILRNADSLSQEEMIELVSVIQKSGERLNRRVEKFLIYSEITTLDEDDEKNLIINKFNYEINSEEVLSEVLNNIELNGRKKDLSINLDRCKIKISQYYFFCIVKELVENAHKFSEGGKRIIVEGSKGEKYYEMLVKDFGKGMTQEEIKNIGAFEQFDRLNEQQVGNGLGLISIKKLLCIINGEIKIESEVNRFTKISLLIPLSIEAE